MDMNKVGEQITLLRKKKNLTQADIAQRLNISYQAVSKWERGETLPDVTLLVDLADILETSVDHILRGQDQMTQYRGKIYVQDIVEGMECFKRFGELIGKDTYMYRCAIDGINEKMNTDIEQAFVDEHIFWCFVTEAIIQNMQAGCYVDISDIQNHVKDEHFKKILCNFASKYGIK